MLQEQQVHRDLPVLLGLLVREVLRVYRIQSAPGDIGSTRPIGDPGPDSGGGAGATGPEGPPGIQALGPLGTGAGSPGGTGALVTRT